VHRARDQIDGLEPAVCEEAHLAAVSGPEGIERTLGAADALRGQAVERPQVDEAFPRRLIDRHHRDAHAVGRHRGRLPPNRYDIVGQGELKPNDRLIVRDLPRPEQRDQDYCCQHRPERKRQCDQPQALQRTGKTLGRHLRCSSLSLPT
jgi:hypothetical protein